MSTSSGRTPLAAKSRSSSPHGTSGVSLGRGPSPVSTRMVRPSARIRYEPRLNRTLCASVSSDSYGCQHSSGIVGKKLQRSNSSEPSDSAMISTSPTRITWLGMMAPKRTTRVRLGAGRRRCYTTARPPPLQRMEDSMSNSIRWAIAALLLTSLAAAGPASAQTTTLTMSSWVSPQHHLTAVVLQRWANEVEKVTNGRVKFTMLPKHPSAPPGTFDAVRDGLVDLSYVTASYTPARHIMPLLAELPGAGETALANSIAYSRIYWKHL